MVDGPTDLLGRGLTSRCGTPIVARRRRGVVLVSA